MPFIEASRGTVTSCSTSDVDRPTQAVWTSTRGGANSGNTSTCICGMTTMPMTIMAAATATTRYRNLRLALMIERMRVRGSAALIPHR